MEEYIDFIIYIFYTLFGVLVGIFHALEILVLQFVPRSWRRKDITGQIVLITGAGSGLGRLVAERLAEKGAKIVIWDVNDKGNNETAKLIKENGGKCYAYTVDLCNKEAVYQTAAKVKKDVGKVDILINNAGIVSGKDILGSSDEEIIRTFDVNILCHFWTLRAFLPAMMKENHGHIVTVASMAGYFPGVPKMIDYSVSKCAAIGLDDSLRAELTASDYDGIKTTCVCPYYINTGMFEGVKSPLFQILDQNYVADEIVDGLLMDKQVIVLPNSMKLLVATRGLFMAKSSYFLLKATGILMAMADFTGRKKDK